MAKQLAHRRRSAITSHGGRSGLRSPPLPPARRASSPSPHVPAGRDTYGTTADNLHRFFDECGLQEGRDAEEDSPPCAGRAPARALPSFDIISLMSDGSCASPGRPRRRREAALPPRQRDRQGGGGTRGTADDDRANRKSRSAEQLPADGARGGGGGPVKSWSHYSVESHEGTAGGYSNDDKRTWGGAGRGGGVGMGVRVGGGGGDWGGYRGGGG